MPYFHKTDSFIGVFTETRHWSLSRTSRIHSTAQSFQIHFNIILPSMCRSSIMFSSLHVFRLKFRCTFHLCHACYVHHTTTHTKTHGTQPANRCTASLPQLLAPRTSLFTHFFLCLLEGFFFYNSFISTLSPLLDYQYIYGSATNSLTDMT